jgi:hypothetical protein
MSFKRHNPTGSLNGAYLLLTSLIDPHVYFDRVLFVSEIKVLGVKALR